MACDTVALLCARFSEQRGIWGVVRFSPAFLFCSFPRFLGGAGVLLLLGSSVFFWGVPSGVLLVFDSTEERQKNARRETAAMSVTSVIQTETTSDFI